MHPPGHERTSKDSLDAKKKKKVFGGPIMQSYLTANCSDLFFFTFPFLNLCFTDSQKNLAKKKKKEEESKGTQTRSPGCGFIEDI